MNFQQAQDIANFRYQLIAPIVTKTSLSRGEIQAYIKEAANKEYQIPNSTKTKVSPRSIERYLKMYREGGWEALKPKGKSRSSRVPEEYIDKACQLKKENPKRSLHQIITTLELAGEVPEGVLKRSTLYDHLKKRNLTGRFDVKESKAYQRYEAKHRGQKWQGDVCHLFYLPDEKDPTKKRKVYLIVWLDDFSRIITHAQCYFDEKLPKLEDSLKKAILKFGKPEIIYADNGKTYSSRHFKSVCGKLGIRISHSRPYRPQGRGKVERLFATIRKSFLPELTLLLNSRSLNLSEVNKYLDTWVTHHYHNKVHSATKQKPMQRFESDDAPIQHVELETLYEAFLLEEERKADKAGVISLHSAQYQVELGLAGKKVQIRYDPYSPEILQVYCEGKRFADATFLEIPENVDYQKKKLYTDTTEERPTTGLNYLELLETIEIQNGLKHSRSKSL